MAASASIAALRGRKPSCKTFSSGTTICLPHFKEAVLLLDWWLIKADSDAYGKRLGVGGFTKSGSQGTRGFLSAPIVKRHDAVTLQTADGITITVSGHLNRSRTLDNGFPPKVCSDFVIGFPYYWEEFAALSFDKLESTSANSEQVSSDAFPITIFRDIFISNLGHHESSLASKYIFDNNILQSTGAVAFSSDGELNSNKASPLNTKSTVSAKDEALLNCIRSKAQRKLGGSKNAVVEERPTDVKRRLVQENKDGADRGVLTSGPMTRSRSRFTMRTA
ncbi:uncharacterized protein [Henckelia pumila]|uniref:uncharacterized protein n=1 Tax=Henckelia pumila TaxID=405737 RepID=UPI003C6DC6D1